MRRLRGLSAPALIAVAALLAVPPAPASEHATLRLVGIGDSTGDPANCRPCDSYVELYGDAAAAALHAGVATSNLARSTDLDSGGLRSLVATDPDFQRALAAADLVTVTIGINDISACGGPETRPCYDAALAHVAPNLRATLARIRRLRRGQPTAIRVTGYYNPAIGDPAAPPGPAFQRFFAAQIRRLNARICAAAAAEHATCIDLLHAFNGRSGREPATSLLMPDHTHPNAAGQRRIAAAIAAAGFAPNARTSARPGGRRVPLAGPEFTAFDPATRTLYASTASRDVAVIDGRRCAARGGDRCAEAIVATIPGAGDAGLVVDASTGTLYVGDAGAGTVTAVDLASCNARATAGCGGPHPAADVGPSVFELAVDPDTRTLYVGHLDPYVSALDTSACNAHTATGCSAAATRIATRGGPAAPTVDRTTGTLYVPENGSGDADGTTMGVYDAATCNATSHAGCAPVADATVGTGPVVAVIDEATRTLYVENQTDNTLSIIDADRCNAHVTVTCARTPPVVAAGASPSSSLVLDAGARTVYVVDEESDTVSAIDIRRCHAGDTTGCARRSPTLATGLSPLWIDEDAATGTLYVIEGQQDDIVALDARACRRPGDPGCRHEAPALPVAGGPIALAVDVAHHTALVGTEDGTLQLLDTDECRAGRVAGCPAALERVRLGAVVGAAALDPATHTAYLGDEAGDRVLVVDTDACHAGRVTGCAPVASVGVGAAGPNAIAVDPGTHTVYTAQGGDSTVAVFSGMRCNAVSPAGCPGQARVVPVGAPPTEVAVDPATGSVYVSEYQADQAELLDGAAGVVATLPTGRNPAGLAVDRGTHTLYVANQAFDEEPGSLSIVDTHRCNAADTSGCGGPFPTAASGRGPFALALDSGTHTVYATDIGDASVSMIDGAGCNATVTTSCGRAPARVPVGDAPFGLALDAPAHTVYALDGDGQVSMIFSRPPRRGARTP